MAQEQRVYIDDLPDAKYDGRLGQNLGTAESRDGKTKRSAVAVDGRSGDQKCVELHIRTESCKKVRTQP